MLAILQCNASISEPVFDWKASRTMFIVIACTDNIISKILKWYLHWMFFCENRAIWISLDSPTHCAWSHPELNESQYCRICLKAKSFRCQTYQPIPNHHQLQNKLSKYYLAFRLKPRCFTSYQCINLLTPPPLGLKFLQLVRTSCVEVINTSYLSTSQTIYLHFFSWIFGLFFTNQKMKLSRDPLPTELCICSLNSRTVSLSVIIEIALLEPRVLFCFFLLQEYHIHFP